MTNSLAQKPNLSRLNKFIEGLAMIQFTALMVIVFLQFCTRYLLNDSLAWTEEVARYLLVSLVFTGSLMLAQRGEHIFLEVTYRLARRPNTKPLVLFAEFLNVIYYLVLAIFGVLLALNTEQFLISVPFPKAIIYAFVAATLLLSAATCGSRFRKLMQQSSEEIFTDIENTTEQIGTRDG